MLCFISISRDNSSCHRPTMAISYSIVECPISKHIGLTTDGQLLAWPCSQYWVSVSVIDWLYSCMSESASMASRLASLYL